MNGERRVLEVVSAADISKRTASRLGILNTAAFSYAYLARTQWMTGDWDDALVSADRAVAINLELQKEGLR